MLLLCGFQRSFHLGDGLLKVRDLGANLQISTGVHKKKSEGVTTKT
jgi:hypothetical protein